MKVKIKLYPMDVGRSTLLGKMVYENQDLPKPQSNSIYYTYTTEGWLRLFFVDGVFYVDKIKVYVHSYWVYTDTSAENTLLMGESLLPVPDLFLNKIGKQHKFAYYNYTNKKSLIKRLKLNKLKRRRNG